MFKKKEDKERAKRLKKCEKEFKEMAKANQNLSNLRETLQEEYLKKKERKEKEIKELELIVKMTGDTGKFTFLVNEAKLEVAMDTLKVEIANKRVETKQIQAVCSYLEQGVKLINDIIYSKSIK